MSPLDYADSSFTASSPRLCLPEPAALFQFLPLGTVRVSVRYRDPLHTFFLGYPFLCLRIEARIGCDQPRNASENPLVRFNRRHQQFAVARPFLEHLIMRNDLVLRFLYLDQLAKLGRLAGLAFADNLGVRFGQADDLTRQLRQPLEHSCLCLSDHMAYPARHL